MLKNTPPINNSKPDFGRFSTQILSPFEGTSIDFLDQYWCEFSSDKYSDDLYPVLDIAFPLSLNRAVKKRKAEFLAGRYCAQKALERAGQQVVSIEQGPHGSPVWPNSIKGTISHTDSMACSVICMNPNVVGIGVDIEKIVDTETLDLSRNLILVADELPLLQHSSLSPRAIFTLIFSLKESFFKAAYPIVREYFDFDRVIVTNIDAKAQIIDFQLNGRLHPYFPENMSFQAYYAYLDNNTLTTLVFLPKQA